MRNLVLNFRYSDEIIDGDLIRSPLQISKLFYGTKRKQHWVSSNVSRHSASDQNSRIETSIQHHHKSIVNDPIKLCKFNESKHCVSVQETSKPNAKSNTLLNVLQEGIGKPESTGEKHRKQSAQTSLKLYINKTYKTNISANNLVMRNCWINKGTSGGTVSFYKKPKQKTKRMLSW